MSFPFFKDVHPDVLKAITEAFKNAEIRKKQQAYLHEEELKRRRDRMLAQLRGESLIENQEELSERGAKGVEHTDEKQSTSTIRADSTIQSRNQNAAGVSLDTEIRREGVK